MTVPTPSPLHPYIPDPPAKPRICEECRYWKQDYGMWTMTGWTGMGRDDGHCHVEPRRLPMQGRTTACRHGELK